MGHDQEKPKPQAVKTGPTFERSAQRSGDKVLKSDVQKQNMTKACTEGVNGLKLSNRFSALDV
ncbi:hypothetical protein Bca52824_003850 [Brassica carinata]|uniref:Uncharacterized protein n=1 Tax=Brassica carinata TaxID=52824 RepID=A0A8X7WPK0_BRACI|nr:hypothetical protein Bca52824_003850 [Brassica carinata]